MQLRPMRIALSALVSCLCALGLLASVAPADERTADSGVLPIDVTRFPGTIPTDAAATRTRDILLNANRYALTSWWASKFRSQGAATYLNFGGTDEAYIRPSADEAYSLAISLFTGAYDPLVTGVSTADARTKADTLVRSVAKAHVVNTTGGWGRACVANTVWQSTYWAAHAGLAGWLLWDDLSATDREYVRKMVECEANSLNTYTVPYYKNPAGTVLYPGDTKAEENSWNALILQLATAMMPRHANWNVWQAKNIELMLSSYAIPSDDSSSVVRNGRTVGAWINGSNMGADGTLINHGKVQPDYMTAVEFNWHNFLTATLAGQTTPTAASWNGSLVYRSMSEVNFPSPPNAAPGGTIYTVGSGDIYYPGGLDWGSFRREPFALMDLQADVFGYDDTVTHDGAYWERLHSQAQLDLQRRGTDGRTYQAASEDTYLAREELVAQTAAAGYLTKWLQAQGTFEQTNAPYPVNGGTIVDDGDAGFAVVSGSWPTATTAVDRYLTGQRTHAAGSGTSKARFTPNLPVTGLYRVYAWWGAGRGNASDAPFTVNPSGTASTTVRVDQRRDGGQWVYLGEFPLAAGTGNTVDLGDDADGTVVADAVRFDRVPYDMSVCHFACQGFQPTQGTNNWTYQDLRTGAWTNISTFSATAWPAGPTWHDATPTIGGWVYQRSIHPGQTNDTARTWTAPRAGVVDIFSRPAKIDPAGDGVVVSIMKNGTTIAGPRTIPANDTIGSDFSVVGVAVARGDQIRFAINRNGTYNNDHTAWDPDITYRAPSACHLACQGFSGVQGADGWRYQDYRAGAWTDIATYYEHSAYPDGATWHDTTPTVGGWIYGPYIHPGQSNDTARAWVAPHAGTVDVTSVPAKVDPQGDGVVVKITKNGTAIAGPRTIAAGDTTGSAFGAASVAVAAGDVIRFEINRNGAYNNDLTVWDPDVVYTP